MHFKTSHRDIIHSCKKYSFIEQLPRQNWFISDGNLTEVGRHFFYWLIRGRKGNWVPKTIPYCNSTKQRPSVKVTLQETHKGLNVSVYTYLVFKSCRRETLTAGCDER